ncbi:MAG: prohead protease/major capsid protein fusion protein [Inquilinaceae bacterium]
MPDGSILLTRDHPTPTLITRRAAIEAGSIDEAARTVEVIFSTGAAVERRDFDGVFQEVLPVENADLTRLNDGASVLDSHRRDGLDSVLGVVEDARIDGGRGVARLRISRRAEAVWQDIRAGVVRHVSIGYTVERWRDGTAANGVRQRVAEAWTPQEVSFVAVGADPGARVRADGDTIRAIAATAGLDAGFADALITRGATVAEARTEALAALSQRGGPAIRTQATPDIVMGADHADPRTRAARIGEALYCRIDPRHQPSAPARPYVGLSLPDIGRELLRAAGQPVTGLSPSTIIERALHTTSDFALILGDTVGRTLRQAYEAAPAALKSAARQTTARDFRAKHRLQLSEAPTLEKVNEHGEFKSGTLAEAEETYKIGTFGRIVGITRQALVNDDVGAFADLSARLGRAAMDFESQFLVELLTTGAGSGPVLAEGKTLFHADHANRAGAGGVIAEGTLSAGRLAMRTQKDLTGKPINVRPRFLLVPAALETTAEKLLTAIQAATAADVNPFGGQLDLLVDSRLDAVSATRWYVVADPAQIDGLEYAYLDGAPGPQIESRSGFEVDGVQIRVRLDYGAGFVDFRSWYMNPGA